MGSLAMYMSHSNHSRAGLSVGMIMTASVLALTLSLAISILLCSHFYFVFTNQCSVEAGVLSTFNPFFVSHPLIGQALGDVEVQG